MLPALSAPNPLPLWRFGASTIGNASYHRVRRSGPARSPRRDSGCPSLPSTFLKTGLVRLPSRVEFQRRSAWAVSKHSKMIIRPLRLHPRATILSSISGCSGGGKSFLLRRVVGFGRLSRVCGTGPADRQGTEFYRGRWSPRQERQQVCRAMRFALDAQHDQRAAGTTSYVVLRPLHHRQYPWPRGATGRVFRRTCSKAMHTFQICSRKVFMTPPWPEMFRNDSERTHSYEDAVAEYDALLPAYERPRAWS